MSSRARTSTPSPKPAAKAVAQPLSDEVKKLNKAGFVVGDRVEWRDRSVEGKWYLGYITALAKFGVSVTSTDDPNAMAIMHPWTNVRKLEGTHSALMVFLQIWWTVVFAVLVTIMQCVVKPKQDWSWPPELDLSGDQAKSVLTSEWFWACSGPMLLGLPWFRSFFKTHKFAVVEQSMTIWWWTNAFFFHTSCDLLSGYFQVMPALTQIYAEMTPAHKQARWANARLHLDSTYFLEMTVEAPLALLMVFLYIRRHPGRYFVETFAVAVQLAGSVVYYMPSLMRGDAAANWVSYNYRAFGMVWIIVPLLVLRRRFVEAVAEAEEKKTN